ncbi:MAG: hypothetical protein WC565_05985 [Parcubacteria group bacterium]
METKRHDRSEFPCTAQDHNLLRQEDFNVHGARVHVATFFSVSGVGMGEVPQYGFTTMIDGGHFGDCMWGARFFDEAMENHRLARGLARRKDLPTGKLLAFYERRW